jgi:hypothetical protein
MECAAPLEFLMFLLSALAMKRSKRLFIIFSCQVGSDSWDYRPKLPMTDD